MRFYFGFYFLFTFNFILGNTIDENEEDFFYKFSEEKKRKKVFEISPNPYYIFHIPPWSDFSKFTEVYMKLKKEHFNDESEEGKKKLKDIELAYKKLKENFEKDKNFNNIINCKCFFYFYFLYGDYLYFLFFILDWI